MTRFTDYTDQADTGAVVLDWKHELLDSDGVILATTDETEAVGDTILWGAELSPLQIEPFRVSQQTSRLRVPVSDSSLLPGYRGGQLLHPDLGRRVRTSCGVVTDSGTTWWIQSTLNAHQMSANSDRGAVELDIELVDAGHPLKSELATAFSWSEGEMTEDVVTRLLDRLMPAEKYFIPPTACTVRAGDKDQGDPILDIVVELLEGCGLELIPTRQGLLSAQSIPPVDDDPTSERWLYGETGIPVQSATRDWQAHRWRGWRAKGGSTTLDTPPLTITVFDLDPTSEGYFPGLGKHVEIGESEYTFASGLTQLHTAAYAQLRRHSVGPGIITFTSVPNPAMRVGDLIQLELPELGVSGPHRVLSFGLPLQVEGLMRVVARGTWTPDLGHLAPGIELDPTCLTSFTDDFNREDQDLQVVPGGVGGSGAWTELGFSWYIQDNKAIQWFNNGWSLAFINRPLCASDHYSEVVIASVPTGRQIGPVCRCSSEFDGYVAMMRPGQVSLEFWFNNKKEATLGSYSYVGSPVGAILRVQAVGNTISVLLNGQTVITASDDRMTGRFVGMLAYGGSGSGAPGVESFDSGAV